MNLDKWKKMCLNFFVKEKTAEIKVQVFKTTEYTILEDILAGNLDADVEILVNAITSDGTFWLTEYTIIAYYK